MEKRKFDLFVHGNIISRGYYATNRREDGACITTNIPFEEVDTNYGIIIEGDMQVDNIYTMNKKIGASGHIYGRDAAIYSDNFESAKGKNSELPKILSK